MPHDLDPDIKRTDSCSDESLTVIEVTMRPCKDTQEHKSNGLHVVPDNTMYNIGLDSAATDLVCLSPPSAIFQPLDSIIFESQLRGHTAILDKIDELPTALVVPLYYALQGRKVHSTGDSHRNSTANSGGRLRGDEVSLRETGSAPLSRYRDAGANGSKSSEASSSANYFPYPSRTSLYASQQSKRLQKPFRVASSRHQGTKDLLEVPFNAEVLTALLQKLSDSVLHTCTILSWISY